MGLIKDFKKITDDLDKREFEMTCKIVIESPSDVDEILFLSEVMTLFAKEVIPNFNKQVISA